MAIKVTEKATNSPNSKTATTSFTSFATSVTFEPAFISGTSASKDCRSNSFITSNAASVTSITNTSASAGSN